MRTRAISLVAFFLLVCASATAQWVQTNIPATCNVRSFASSGTIHFAGTGGGGVYFSVDSGASWHRTGLQNGVVFALAVSGQHLFAGIFHAPGAVRSTNNGITWEEANSGLLNKYVWSLALSGTTLFAGTAGSGVFLSTDNGASWTAASIGMESGDVRALGVIDSMLFAGTWGEGGGVYRSSDNGAGWSLSNTGLQHARVASFAVSGTTIYAGTDHSGVFASTNYGATWNDATGGLSTDAMVNALAACGTHLFAGTGGLGVHLSTNGGASWSAVSAETNVSALAVCGPNLLMGTFDAGLWIRPLSEMLTFVDRKSHQLPYKFLLSQNYPNPFNPNTTIKYELPKASSVTLSVYDMLGREVSVLVNENRPAGFHSVQFDAGELASGVYIYRLQAGDFVQTCKLLLLR